MKNTDNKITKSEEENQNSNESNLKDIEWDKFDTGDIILFSGKNFWFSYMVEYFTGSPFSHIGIVLKNPTQIDPKLKGLHLLESGEENVKDEVDNKKKFGVQIIPLEDKIKNYDGKVVYRKLNWSKNNMTRNILIWLIYQKIQNKPYDINIFDFICAGLKLDIGDKQKTNEFFCSALVAFIYTKMGLLKEDTNWTLWSPKDFNDKNLKNLEDFAFLESDIWIK